MSPEREGNFIAKWGRGNDRFELVEGRPAEEDVVGRVGVYDQVSDLEGFASPLEAERCV